MGSEASGKRCNSRSSAGSSRGSVTSGIRPNSSRLTHDKATNQYPLYPSAGNRRSDIKIFSRPKYTADYRLSTMSFVSTVPSTTIQTPGIHQGAFEHQPSGLSVSVEDEEDVFGSEGNAGGGNHQEKTTASRGPQGKSSKTSEKQGSGGSMIAERRRQFEGSNVVNDDVQGQTASASRPWAKTQPVFYPKAIEMPTFLAHGPSSNDKTGTKPMTRPTTNAAKAATSAHSIRNADRPVGLGYPNIMNRIGNGLSWKEEAEALDRRLEDATRSFSGAGTSGKCLNSLAGE